MKPCKEKLPDGTPCPNHVDKGQEKCPYHRAIQVAEERNRHLMILSVQGLIKIVKNPEMVKKLVARFIRL